jgi:hypothetical protein
VPTLSTSPNPPETTRWYSPGSTISQAISLVGIALAILIIWGPTAPVSSLLPWSLDFSKIYGWIGDPWRISLSYAAIISGSLWPFWVLRHSGTPDPLGSWKTKVAWPFAEGGALVFAFTQITVFLLEGQYVQAGFNSDTVFSLGVAALVMLLEAGRRSYKLASEAFAIAPVGTLAQGPVTGQATQSPAPGGSPPPSNSAGPPPGVMGRLCSNCREPSTAGAAFCSSCGTRTSPDLTGIT